MNLVATNDMDEIYEDPEYGEMGELEELLTKVDESEDSDDMAASVEAAVKQEEEIVITEAAAVNGGDGDDVNTFAAAIVVEDEAVNAKYVGVEAVKGDIMVKGSKANATAKGQVLKEDERVEGYETREVLGVKMPRRSERHKKISQGLDAKALNYKTHKQRFKVQELQGSRRCCRRIRAVHAFTNASDNGFLDGALQLVVAVHSVASRGGFGGRGGGAGAVARDDEGSIVFAGRDEGPPPLFPPVEMLPELPEIAPKDEAMLQRRRRMASFWRYSAYYVDRPPPDSKGHSGGPPFTWLSAIPQLPIPPFHLYHLSTPTPSFPNYSPLPVYPFFLSSLPGRPSRPQLPAKCGAEGVAADIAAYTKPPQRLFRRHRLFVLCAPCFSHRRGKKKVRKKSSNAWVVGKGSAANDLNRLDQLATLEQKLDKNAARANSVLLRVGWQDREGKDEEKKEGEDDEEVEEEEEEEEIGEDDYAQNFGFDDDDEYLDEDDGADGTALCSKRWQGSTNAEAGTLLGQEQV
ncbi:unnamed protein product [Closterium sp. Naga37s-1]|nr:unnamed protein product [Closterium sp. Naga37s-1]